MCIKLGSHFRHFASNPHQHAVNGYWIPQSARRVDCDRRNQQHCVLGHIRRRNALQNRRRRPFQVHCEWLQRFRWRHCDIEVITLFHQYCYNIVWKNNKCAKKNYSNFIFMQRIWTRPKLRPRKRNGRKFWTIGITHISTLAHIEASAFYAKLAPTTVRHASNHGQCGGLFLITCPIHLYIQVNIFIYLC